MKINKAKLLVGTLAIASVAATVGSISGTVAWFQYSTRATVAYRGASAHCTENLEIRINSGTEAQNPWKHDLLASDITGYLAAAVADGGANRANGNALHPITSQELKLATDPVANTFYKNPIYQYITPSSWKTATAEDYVSIPLELRVLDVNGESTEEFLQKNIYITNITMQARASDAAPGYDATEHIDLSDALRVAVSAGTDKAALTDYTTFSKSGTAVNVYGNLDLNADGAVDLSEGYEFSTGRTTLIYGENGKQAESIAVTQLPTTATSTTVGVANDSDPYDIKGKPIGQTDPTNADATKQTLKVNLLIYLEGWTSLAFNTADTHIKTAVANYANLPTTGNTEGDICQTTDNSWYYRYSTTRGWHVIHTGSIWDAVTGVGAEFDLGIRFSAEAHKDHA